MEVWHNIELGGILTALVGALLFIGRVLEKVDRIPRDISSGVKPLEVWQIEHDKRDDNRFKNVDERFDHVEFLIAQGKPSGAAKGVGA